MGLSKILKQSFFLSTSDSFDYLEIRGILQKDSLLLTLAEDCLVSTQVKFLIVDDSQVMRRIVGDSLLRIGYGSRITAADGEEALSRFDREGDVSFVITDLEMPNMNGIELVRALRDREDGLHVPVLMVMNHHPDDEESAQLRDVGVNGYIVKPFLPSFLKKKIDDLLVARSQ